jgi:hypothetical protein
MLSVLPSLSAFMIRLRIDFQQCRSSGKFFGLLSIIQGTLLLRGVIQAFSGRYFLIVILTFSPGSLYGASGRLDLAAFRSETRPFVVGVPYAVSWPAGCLSTSQSGFLIHCGWRFAVPFGNVNAATLLLLLVNYQFGFLPKA